MGMSLADIAKWGLVRMSTSKQKTLDSLVSGDWNENQQAVIDAGGGLVVADESGNLTGPGGAIAGSGSGGSTTVVDSLTSTSTTSALSANQGRVLNGKIPTVVDDLTTGGSTSALSAQQGVVLKNNVSQKQDTLVSGGNIKTVGTQSLLGSGNITRASLMRGAPAAFQTNGISGVAPYYFSQLCLIYTSTTQITAGNIYYFPFWVSGPLAINRIGCRVATAGTGTARCALYTSDATTGLPATLVCDSGDLDTTSTGDKEGTVSATLDAGLYWMAVQVSASCSLYGNATPGGMYMGSTSSSAGSIRGLLMSSSYGAYTSTAGTITGVTAASVFGIWVRYV